MWKQLNIFFRLVVVVLILCIGYTICIFADTNDINFDDANEVNKILARDMEFERLENQLNHALSSDVESARNWSDYYNMVKEGKWLVYIHTRYGKSFEEYDEWAAKFDSAYQKHGINYFYRLDEEEYNARLKGIAQAYLNIGGLGKIIADSGFRPENNSVPLYNLIIQSKGTDLYTGICKGMAMFAAYSYVQNTGWYNKEIEFFKNTYLRGKDKLDKLAISNGYVDLNFISTNIKNKEISTIAWKGEELNRFGVKEAPFKTMLSLLDYDTYYNVTPNPYSLDFDKLEFDEDHKLLKTLILFMEYGNTDPGHQKEWLYTQGYLDYYPKVNNAWSEVEAVIKDLQEKKPVVLGIFCTGIGCHAIVGYRISQDRLNKNIYYLDCYDPNFPLNQTGWRSGYTIRVTLVKTPTVRQDGSTVDTVMMKYTPYIIADNFFYNSFIYDDSVEFYHYDDSIIWASNTDKEFGKLITGAPQLDK